MNEFTIRRVVVALDATCDSRAAVETGTALAASWRVDLRALFVEDAALRYVAELPFTRQISLPRPVTTAFDLPGLEAEFAALAARLRRYLAVEASRRAVPWTFEIVRDLARAEEWALDAADLLVAESAARPFARHLLLESPLRAALGQARRPVLFLPPGRAAAAPVMVVDDGAPGAQLALAAAENMAAAIGGELVVLASGESDAAGRRRAPPGGRVSVRALKRVDEDAIRHGAAGCGLLVIGRDSLPAAAIDALLAKPPCAMLIV
jgi:nucleotide-binding universal stress UspA family protein